MAILEIIALAVAAYGAYSASEAASAQEDAAARQGEISAGQLALAREVFDTITRPQFIRASAYLWGYGVVWGTNIIEKVVECGTSICEYTRDENVDTRISGTVLNAVTRARRTGMRGVRRGASGTCLDNEFRFVALQAALTVKTIGIAEQFEETKALAWGQFYWSRNINAAQAAGNVIATGANLLTGAGTGIQSAMNGMIGLSGTTFDAAVLAANSAKNQQTLYNGVGAFSGFLFGKQDGVAAGTRSGIIELLGNRFSGTAGSGGSSSGFTGVTYDPTLDIGNGGFANRN